MHVPGSDHRALVADLVLPRPLSPMFTGGPGWARPPEEAAFDDVRRPEGSTVMLSEREVSAAVGSTAYGTDGGKLGTVEAFFVDDRTGAPTWVAVSTGLFGTRHSIVPAVDATFADGRCASRSPPRP